MCVNNSVCSLCVNFDISVWQWMRSDRNFNLLHGDYPRAFELEARWRKKLRCCWNVYEHSWTWSRNGILARLGIAVGLPKPILIFPSTVLKAKVMIPATNNSLITGIIFVSNFTSDHIMKLIGKENWKLHDSLSNYRSFSCELQFR